MSHIKVIKQHRSVYPNPLKFAKGDQIQFGVHEEDYPGWKWSIASDGNKGWVPESYLEINGSSGTLNRDYDATELDVNIGDELQLILEESGWIQCKTGSGLVGWIPKECVE